VKGVTSNEVEICETGKLIISNKTTENEDDKKPFLDILIVDLGFVRRF
jgi:hypothetical protein